MEELIINGKGFKYFGQPLSAVIFDGSYWGGRSNFLASNETQKTETDVQSLEDCFVWMKRWSEETDYVCGYVLDYSSKTIYYDKQESLDYLLKKSFPKLGKENYFDKFIEKNFQNWPE